MRGCRIGKFSSAARPGTNLDRVPQFRHDDLLVNLQQHFTPMPKVAFDRVIMAKSDSRCSSIPQSRSMVCDILRYDRAVPTFAHDRSFDVSELVAARRNAKQRISWPAIFIKAYALNAQQYPRLRQTWMGWPWSHLYDHHEHIGMLVVHRKFENDDWLFWGKISNPAAKSIVDIQEKIDRFQTDPVETVFDHQLWLARRGALLRRLVWWVIFHVSGAKKCRRMGTFFLTTISGKGAEVQDPPSMLTSALTYGPIDQAGKTRVTITYDHRLLDGHNIADILVGLEQTMQGPLLAELRQLGQAQTAA